MLVLYYIKTIVLAAMLIFLKFEQIDMIKHLILGFALIIYTKYTRNRVELVDKY